VVPHPVGPHWPGDVLNLVLAQILIRKGQSVAYLVAYYSRDANPTWFNEGLQARRQIHTVAENVVLLDYYVAQIDADAKLDAHRFGQLRLAIDHRALNRYAAANSFNNTRKFRQKAVPCWPQSGRLARFCDWGKR
jgi:hypothetical protein